MKLKFRSHYLLYLGAILGDRLSDQTICMAAVHYKGFNKTYRHYDVHNLYGSKMMEATFK